MIYINYHLFKNLIINLFLTLSNFFNIGLSFILVVILKFSELCSEDLVGKYIDLSKELLVEVGIFGSGAEPWLPGQVKNFLYL